MGQITDKQGPVPGPHPVSLPVLVLVFLWLWYGIRLFSYDLFPVVVVLFPVVLLFSYCFLAVFLLSG